MGGFLILVLILGAAWLLFVVPARRRRRSHSAMQDSVGVGDETLKVEIAPDVVVTLDRRAVAAVAREVEVEVDAEEDPKNAAESPPEPG